MEGKRVCVIGGAGFVGTHLVKQLLSRGAIVTVLDDMSRGSIEKLTELGVAASFARAPYSDKIVSFAYGDCSLEGVCRDTFKDQDCIFNLAAHVAGVIYNQSRHFEMFTRNLATQSMPLRIAQEYDIERFLNVSSVCVYSPKHNSPAYEVSGWAGKVTPANEGYSLAKRMGERLAVWANDNGLHTVRVRPSNVFGPLDYFDDKAHVIPALIKKCLDDDVIRVNGTGQEIREFIYVEDVAAGMIAALEKGTAGGVYNLGTSGDTAISISDLVLKIRAATCTEHKEIIFESKHDPGDNVRFSDSSKANSMLNWGHKVGIDEGLKRTVEWYASYHNDVR